MALTRLTQPSAEPFTVDDAKVHLRESLVDVDNDAYIGLLIAVARQTAEERLERTLLSSQWQTTLDDFECGRGIIKLQRPPIISVESVKYIDTGGTQQTLDPSLYQVDIFSEPGRIVPVFGAFWPIARYETLNAVTVSYTAGYGGAGDIPKTIVHWMKLAIKDMYDRRGASAERPIVPQDFASDLLWMGNAVWSA